MVLGQTAMQVIGRTDIETAGALALQDVDKSHVRSSEW